MNDKIKQAAARAADWLEANPNNHITGRAAEDAEGEIVPTTSRKACSFCAIGRLAVELRLPDISTNYHPLYKVIGTREATDIYSRNDADKRQGLAALRELANG